MDEEIKQKVFQQTMDIFVIPEIKKRIEDGRMKENTPISKIQIIFSLDKGKNEVRLNKEVKAIVEGKVTRDVKRGDMIYEKDLDYIKNIKLTDEDINCGHITFFLFRSHWIISFDFRYNKEKVKNHIDASREFFETAVDSLDKKRIRAFYENAFASAELSAIAILSTLPSKEILDCRWHKTRLSQFKNWADLGNVKMEFSTTLSKLDSLRDSARYLHSEEYKSENSKNIKNIVGNMIEFAEDSIK